MSDNKLLRLPEVMELTGLSKSSLYAMIKKQSFPGGVKLSERAVAWPSISIRQWIDQRIAESTAVA